MFRVILAFVLGVITQIYIRHSLLGGDPSNIMATLAVVLIGLLTAVVVLLFFILRELKGKKPVSAAVVSDQPIAG